MKTTSTVQYFSIYNSNIYYINNNENTKKIIYIEQIYYGKFFIAYLSAFKNYMLIDPSSNSRDCYNSFNYIPLMGKQ